MSDHRLAVLIREEMTKELEAKTGWGRNEAIGALDRAISSAALRLVEEIKSGGPEWKPRYPIPGRG